MVSSTFVRSAGLLSTLFSIRVNAAGAKGTGTTTRYWDCCKPSCAWSGKAPVSAPVRTCDIKDAPLTDPNAQSGCNGGTAFMCSNQAPWAINSTLAYGFAAVNIAGGSESSWCSACYALKFTSGPALGKTLIVQATNTGGDLGSNQFDLAIPGGGVGIFNGCTSEWGAPSSGWGRQYGGIAAATDCSAFPSALKSGCGWRFDWFAGSDNPTVDFEQVACPAEILAKTGSQRTDDASMPNVVGPVSVAPVVEPVVPPTPNSPPVASPPPPPVVNPVVPATPNPQPVASSPAAPVVPPMPISQPSTPPAGQVALYYKCGGIGYTGSTTCVEGATCKVQNPYYYQCVASGEGITAAPVSPPKIDSASSTPPAGQVAKYYKCGGIGYTGSTTCVEGSTCKVQNPYYSQCV